MYLLDAFRLPELVDGVYVAVAINRRAGFVTSHRSTEEKSLREPLGIGANYKHAEYDAHFGRGNWSIMWTDNPNPDDMRFVRDRLDLPAPVVANTPQERTMDDLVYTDPAREDDPAYDDNGHAVEHVGGTGVADGISAVGAGGSASSPEAEVVQGSASLVANTSGGVGEAAK